jgi:hypothetical protein
MSCLHVRQRDDGTEMCRTVRSRAAGSAAAMPPQKCFFCAVISPESCDSMGSTALVHMQIWRAFVARRLGPDEAIGGADTAIIRCKILEWHVVGDRVPAGASDRATGAPCVSGGRRYRNGDALRTDPAPNLWRWQPLRVIGIGDPHTPACAEGACEASGRLILRRRSSTARDGDAKVPYHIYHL